MTANVVTSIGETVTIFPPTGPSDVTAVFAEPYIGASVSGQPVERPEPTLLFTATVWNASGLSRNDRVEVRSKMYTIVDIQPDDGGGVTTILRAYDSD